MIMLVPLSPYDETVMDGRGDKLDERLTMAPAFD
jgi:hypothetical protein